MENLSYLLERANISLDLHVKHGGEWEREWTEMDIVS